MCTPNGDLIVADNVLLKSKEHVWRFGKNQNQKPSEVIALNRGLLNQTT